MCPVVENDRLLLLELQQGNVRAFETIHARYAKVVYARFLNLVKDPIDAQELTQDLFVKVWERRLSIDVEQSFIGLLQRIAKNMAIDFFRKFARETKLYEAYQYSNSELDCSTENEIEANETAVLITKAVNNLSPQRKQAFLLCKIEGKTHYQAAQIMGVSPSTVNNHLVAALTLIKNHLEKSGRKVIPITSAIALLSL